MKGGEVMGDVKKMAKSEKIIWTVVLVLMVCCSTIVTQRELLFSLKVPTYIISGAMFLGLLLRNIYIKVWKKDVTTGGDPVTEPEKQ